MTRERKMNIQLATAVVLALAGLVLIMMGFGFHPSEKYTIPYLWLSEKSAPSPVAFLE